MAPNPDFFLSHLQQFGYHPRSDKHSNCLSQCIVNDLVEHCPAIRAQAARGEIVYDLNFTLVTGTATWNVDLVLGQPAPGQLTTQPGKRISRTRPSTVRIAIEIKAVMTEHRKAVKNRKRDFEAHHDHVHRYDQRTIAGGLLIINGAATFKSPLRLGITQHREPDKLVRHCVEEMRAVAQRNQIRGIGLDALAVVVVDVNNQDVGSARYLSGGASPLVGDPMHYDAFIQKVCGLYRERFDN